MEGPQVAFLVLLLALTGYLGNRLWAAINGPSYRERILRLASADQHLTDHTAEFARPEILQVNCNTFKVKIELFFKSLFL